MGSTVKINGETVVAVRDIKTIQPLSDEDRASISDNLQIDGSAFNARLTFSDNKTKLARETVDELKRAGLALVNVGSDRFVPAGNIRSAKPLSKDDAEALAAKGYTLSQTFRSTVDTSAGLVLSSGYPQQVMDRKERALGIGGQGIRAAAPEAPAA